MKRKWIAALLLGLCLCALGLTAWASGYALSAESARLDVKKSLKLTVTLDGKRTRGVTWASEDEQIAAVSQDGRVRALRAGQTVITATAPDGSRLFCALTVTQPVTALKAASRLTLEAKQTSVFSVEVLPADATDRTLTYASSNEKVATVDKSGVIHALKAGSCRLTARSSSGKKVSLSLTVTQPVTEILPEKAEYTLDTGRTLTLKAALSPADATAKKLTFTSSDPEIASVSSRGRVTGKNPGTVTITLRAESGVTAFCTVRVVRSVKSVRAASSRSTLNAGEKQTPVFSVLPQDATDQSLTFASSDPSVLSVDPATGEVTAIKPGTATLTARSINGKTDRIRFTVVRPVQSVSLSGQSLTLERGSSLRLSAHVEPADATDKRLTYATSDKKIAAVSSNGTVSARKAGEVTLTVTAKSGASASVRLTVTQPVTRVSFGFSRRTIGKYETVELTPALLPADATDRSLVFSSSDPSVAAVNQKGELTGVNPGTAVVTAKAASGKKDSFRVTVKEIALTGVRVERLYLNLRPGESAALNASPLPKNATEQRLSYESRTPDVATVDEKGRVQALSLGETQIVVSTAGERPFTQTVRVVVSEQPIKRLAGVTIGLNAGHQTRSNATPLPVAPGSRDKVYSIKVGSAGVVTRVPEYEVNLQVALRLQKLLEAEGANVVMVRTRNDVNLTNIERAEIMNEAKCDLALQIHCNGSQNKTLQGFSVYAQQLGDTAPRSQTLAQTMLPAILSVSGAKNAGCHTSVRYASLNWSSVPSVLLEMGYLSNADEDRLLASADYQDLLAQAICEGLVACFAK